MATITHRHDPEQCPACDIGPFSRNNYFTGKLLVERDFTDEQTYLVDKLRHHNRRLHGWGVVCGLRVHQHPTPGCQDRFVCIEPGTAIDCCGHEIVVREEECIDLSLLPAIQALEASASGPAEASAHSYLRANAVANGGANGDRTHTLQICLRYRECGTEPIPALYDDCGCDDTRCLPNRILESFDVDVRVDPPATADTWTGPRLVRGTDIAIADAGRVVFNPADGLLYVVAGTMVHAVDRPSRAILRSHDLTSAVHGLDVSPNGTHLYALREEDGGGMTLTVLQASDLSVTFEDLVVDGDTPVATAVSPAADGSYLVLVTEGPTLLVYGPDLESAAPSPPKEIPVPGDRTLMAIAPDGSTAFLAGTDAVSTDDPAPIEAVDLTSGTSDGAVGGLLPGVQPSAMATATEGAAMLLVVADAAGNVSVADPDGSTVHGPVELSGPAVDLSGQPWAYALQTAGGASRMQAVGIPRVVAGSIDPVGPPVGFAGDAKELAVASGAVYVAYDGTTGEPGGVAVFDVVQGDCADILWESLDGCDDCDEPNCVVLATITGYRPGFAMLDPADPPTDPADDLSAGSARIDNRAGRRLLPSTSTLTDVITCLLDQGGGGQGPAGPPGPGLEAGLVRITALSWTHDKPIQVNSLQTIVGFPGAPTERYGVIIAFTAEVSLDGIDAIHVFQVEAPSLDLNGEEAHYGYACRCPIRGSVVPVQPSINGNLVTKGRVLVGADHASAIAFVFDPVFVANVLLERDISDLWVRLRGDFVLDTGNPARAIDAEFVRHDFDTGDRPRGSALGVQGGIFESWFEPRRH